MDSVITPNEVAAFIAHDYRGLPAVWQYGSVQANVSHWLHNNEALIIFRGTESDGWDVWLDWLRNFRAMPWKDPDIGWAAAGFLKGVRGVLEADNARMSSDIVDMAQEGVSIHFGGHSKGGAEAAICAALCAARGLCVPASLTVFGSARPGRMSLPDGIPVTNLRYRGDPVPFVAPWNRHVVPLRRVGGEGRPSVKDHRIRNYQKCV